MSDALNWFSRIRVLRTAVAAAVLITLASCGGGNSTPTPPSGIDLQTVAFGTSLTDGGTYSAKINPIFGGGRFTTNPGQVWAQVVSEHFGHSLTPAFNVGFGQSLTAQSGGFNYAQGAAQVSLGGNLNSPLATAMPVSWQIDQYLSKYMRFYDGQLVLIDGGANEILNFAQDPSFASFGAAVVQNQAALQNEAGQLIASGQFPNTAAGQSQAFAAALANFMASNASTYPLAGNIVTAAKTMASLVTTKVIKNGATHIAVANVPDIGQTPVGKGADLVSPGTSGLFTAIAGAYNVTLAGALATEIKTKQVVLIDTFSWLDAEVVNFANDGFSVSNTAMACDLDKIQANAVAYGTANPSFLTSIGLTASQFGQAARSSLFCSAQTLVASNADTKYMFADSVHPTTGLHKAFAGYVEQQLAAAGIGKAP
jgi:phospholipase/lecithinase/hemolysin